MQVLRRFAMEPLESTRITVVLDVPVAVYSGMVPGFVAGQYDEADLEIDVVPLARRAGARVMLAPAVRVDAAARRIHVGPEAGDATREPIAYDVASVDIGSTVVGLDLPGIREHALATRPIGCFVRRFDEAVRSVRETARRGRKPRIVVVGAGAGGVELAFAVRERLRGEGLEPEITLVHAGDRILPGAASSVVEKVMAAAERRGIEVVLGRKVVAAEEGSDGERVAVLDDESGNSSDEKRPFDLLLWVTGAVAHGVFRDSDLPTDERGFVRVDSGLRVEGLGDLFAVGDCATLVDHPETPKAGVYAVRQGPVLIENLRRWLDARPPRTYRPQSDFLTLLNLGDGTAIGGKWGVAVEGAWVMRLKDWIDRRFVRRFQVLDSAGALSEEFPAMAEMDVLCGGCAAKVGQSVLERALARLDPVEDASVVLGLDRPDDAAAVRLEPSSEGSGVDAPLRVAPLLVTTVDAFKGFTDDPWLVGRIAAVNAVSDLYAKGVDPRHALVALTLPEGLPDEAAEEVIVQVLAGVRAALDPLGCTVIGGHTTTSAELVVGLTVSGTASSAEALLSLDRLRAGQALVLTKALGTGVVFHADMAGRARGAWVEAALSSMARANAAASRVAREHATAATDVTGFGLLGHLASMVRASDTSAVVDASALPALPGALDLLARGERSTFHEENARARRGLAIDREILDRPEVELAFDPQTSGGLLFGVDSREVDEVLEALHAAGDSAAAVIGEVRSPRRDGAPVEVVCDTIGETRRKI